MKRLLPILLCLLALAVPRLYGQDHTVTFSAQPAEGGKVEASYFAGSYEDPKVPVRSGDKVSHDQYVDFTATPNEGYEVEKWEFNGTVDELANGRKECSKTIDADMTVVVYFKKTAGQAATHTVTVSAEPEYGGKNYVAIKDYDTYDLIASGSAVADGKAIYVYAYCDKNKYKFDYWEVNGVRSEEFTSDKIKNYVVTEDVTFKAYFKELEMLPVTFSVNGPGTIVVTNNSSHKVLTSGDKVLEGVYVKFVATPGENAELRDWTINGATDKVGKTKFSYKMDPTKPNTIVANFVSTAPAKEYVVNFVADPAEGGSVTAENTVSYKPVKTGASVAENASLKFTATANEGYEFEKWTVNGADTPGSFTDPTELSLDITGKTDVVAHFKAPEKYKVTFAAEPTEYGTLTATRYDRENDEEVPFDTEAEFETGAFLTFTAKPGADYKVEKWTVNGTAIDMPSNPNKYEIELKEAIEVKVVFTTKPNEVTLKYSVAAEPAEAGQIAVAVTPKGGGDPVSVDSGKKVARGSSVTFTATPATGYEVEKWLVNGTKDKKAGQSTTLTMTLDEDTEVQLFFQKEAKKCTINLTADPVEGGTIKATGYVNDVFTTITNGKIVPENSYLDFEATANEGYEFEKWTFNGTKKENLFGEPNKLSFVQIIDNTNVVAHFKKVASKITITYTAGEHGKFTEVKVQKDGEKDVIIKSGDEVDRGSYIVFNVVPDKGYIVDKWTVNGEEVHSREVNSYDASFDETSEVKVTFRKPKLTIAAAEGGKIVAKVGDKEVSNDADVALGENVSIEATPDAGYELTALTANDKDILAAKSFAMKGDTKVVATFTKKAQPTTYKVTLKPTEHGTISIKEQVDLNAVPEGTKLTVEAKGANDKCELTKLTANGEDILKDKTFTVTKDTEVVAVFVDHTGIDAVVSNAFVIYPNPASESATVTGLAPEAAVALYTLDGQLITRLVADRSGRLQIDLTALSEGTYLVVTEGVAQRLVVKH